MIYYIPNLKRPNLKNRDWLNLVGDSMIPVFSWQGNLSDDQQFNIELKEMEIIMRT